MTRTVKRVSSAVLVLLATGTGLVAKERILADQWSRTRSVLFMADADGTNARKLVAGVERDYNASLSSDGQWVLFTSERNGSSSASGRFEISRMTARSLRCGTRAERIRDAFPRSGFGAGAPVVARRPVDRLRGREFLPGPHASGAG